MNRKTLKGVDLELGNDTISNILINGRGLYFYYNEPNKKTKNLLIHKHFCGQCSWGSGKIDNKEVGRNGVWIGPFANKKHIVTFIKKILPKFEGQLEECSCLNS